MLVFLLLSQVAKLVFSLFTLQKIFINITFDRNSRSIFKKPKSSVNDILKQAINASLSGKPQFTNRKYSWTGIIETF